jgi:hypothetical protein
VSAGRRGVVGHPGAPRRHKWIAIVATLVALCAGVIRLVNAFSSPPSSNVDVSASERSDLANLAAKLDASSELTYTAGYTMPNGTTATVVHQPPNVAFAGPTGRFIVTHDAVYRCSATTQPATCTKAINTNDGVDLRTDQLIPGWIGQGFVTPRTAGFTLLAAASLGSHYMVMNRGVRAIAGLQSTCLDVTSLLPDRRFYLGLGAFGICVADNGVLTSFHGAGDAGSVGVELTTYAETADTTAFQPPAGYLVVNVDSLTGPSASPSASPLASTLR